jgi:hypothetical protein
MICPVNLEAFSGIMRRKNVTGQKIQIANLEPETTRMNISLPIPSAESGYPMHPWTPRYKAISKKKEITTPYSS